jgi:hypothetical protein
LADLIGELNGWDLSRPFFILAYQIVEPASGSKIMCIIAVIQSAAKTVTQDDDSQKQCRINTLIYKLFLFHLCAFPGVGM